MNQFLFKLYSLPNAIEEIKPYWKTLEEEKKQSLKFFQTYEWNLAINQHLLNTADIFYVVIFIATKPIAIFPLQVSKFNFLSLFNTSVLQFPTSQHITLSDCICLEFEETELLSSLIKFLNQSSPFKWSAINFNSLSEKSDILKLLALSNNDFLSHASPTKTSSYISCGNTYEQSTSHMTRKFLRNIRRFQNKAEREGEIKFISITPKSNEIDSFFQQFLAIEAGGWKGQKNTAIKCDPKLISFYKQLSKINEKNLTAVINTLYLDDIPIATQLGLKLGDQLNLLKIGFSEHYKSLGPGNVILSKAISHFSAQNIQTISFVTAPIWAEKWKSGSEDIFNLSLFNETYYAKFLYFMMNKKKKYKTHLANNPNKMIEYIRYKIKTTRIISNQFSSPTRR